MQKTERVKFIERRVMEKKDELLDICRRMIDVSSVTGNEGAVQEKVRDILTELGFEIDMWEPNDEEMQASDLFVPTGESFVGRPVVVGTLKGNGSGKSLLINGHVDVVTEEPAEKWHTDPYKAVVKDGKLYGRGAADMKGGLAMAIFAASIAKEYGELGGDLTIVSVPAEENGGNGTVASILRGYHEADAALYPEPTSNHIQPAHRGAAFYRVYLEGKAAHGGTKYKGVSAVEKGFLVAEKLAELEKHRHEHICSQHPLYANYPLSAPVTLGIFRGGQFTSGVPEECFLEGCIEFVPGEKNAEVRQSLEDAVMSLCEEDDWLREHPPVVEWFGLSYEAAATDPDHPFVQTAMQCYENVVQHEPTVNGFEAGTDMRLLTNNYHVPGIIFGPGDLEMAHAPNEYVQVDQLVEGAMVLTEIISEWCKDDTE